jgi:transmembrane sensor
LGGRDSSVEERRAIEAEAARLFLEARESGDPAAWDRAYEWVAQDPAHGVAFAKAEVSWELSERLKEIAPQLEPEAIAGPAGHFEALFSGRMVAALVAIAMVGTLGSIGLQKIAAVDRYRTAVGAEREIRLADGSIAHLNTDTAIEVSLRSDRRFIRLLRGEARFDVYLNRRAPFVVQANDATLRALGTDFNVRLRPEMTEVTVIEGGVAVRDGEAPPRTVTAGTLAAIRGGAVAMTPLDRAQIAQRTAWRTGTLAFAGEPLAQAVEEVNRYRKAPILLGSPGLSTLPVTGVFRVGRSDTFVRALARTHGLQATFSRDGTVMLAQSGR